MKAIVHYRDGVKRSIQYHLKKFGPLKFYLTIAANLHKIDKDDVREEQTAYFCGQTRRILNEFEFDRAYRESKSKIWEEFDEWLKEGSGWRLDSIETVDLNICEYVPIRGSTYIKTPKALEVKHAIFRF